MHFCDWSMEESQESRGWFYNNRKVVAGLIIIIISFQVTTIFLQITNPPLPDNGVPNYSLTVWILPEEEEFYLHLDFYISEHYAADGIDRLSGYTIRVSPGDNEQNDAVLYGVPEGLSRVWVKIYFDEETQEPFIIHRLDLGQKITTTLLGRDISILWEPWFGE